ncbi:nuclear transport factor 2 family protein [Nocardia jinanensis]|uniref:SnoaL-like domain-containing protein n=1 Tax=Nocardia jinanensis TaxID=382504 RepID=A0A917VVU7_9NOCA|nr:nuclear transport factor 2 family protein [Nocardia jinanensis]GGL19603.1 hypothetical protein GCM10011588_37820 [Nocardia jinanensis]
MDRFDRALFLSAFQPDAVIAAGAFVGGPGELYEWAAAMHEQGQSATQHNLLNHTCDIDGDTAHTETYYLFAARNRDETNWWPAAGTSTGWSGRTERGGSRCAPMSSNGPERSRPCLFRSPG